MKQSFNLLFYPKKPKGYATGPVPIYLRISVDGIEREISTKLDTDPLKWSSASQRVSGKSDPVKAVNDYLEVLHTKAINARTKLTELSKPITADNIKLLVLGQPLEASRSIMPIFVEHNERMEKLVDKDFARGTLTRFQTTYSYTLEFVKEKYKVSDITLDKLDYTFMESFEHWLKSTKNCQHNTAMKHLSSFKKIVLICVKRKWLPSDPFGGYTLGRRKVKRPKLTQPQLNTILNKVFKSERLSIVRDIFIFCCYTGLDYSDVKKLRKSHIIIGIDGFKWIHCARRKTDNMSDIPVLPLAEMLIDRYANHPDCQQTGLVFPVRSNQKMNEYLKEIGEICGIHFDLEFHDARRAFGTTVTLNNGVPIETVSRLLAHEKISTTQESYAEILDTKISKDMLPLRQIFST